LFKDEVCFELLVRARDLGDLPEYDAKVVKGVAVHSAVKTGVL
jgi:hypothetical protein